MLKKPFWWISDHVSCNPATQARDTELLREAGYNIKKISLVDQFPHNSFCKPKS